MLRRSTTLFLQITCCYIGLCLLGCEEPSQAQPGEPRKSASAKARPANKVLTQALETRAPKRRVRVAKASPKKAKASSKTKASPGPTKQGFRFPSFKVMTFQYKPKRRYYRTIFDFATVIGKKPVLLFYFLPNHEHSITEFKAFAAAAKLFKDKIHFFAVTKAQTNKEARVAYKKVKELKIEVPVLLDQKGLLAFVMLTRRVPAYALFSKTGYLRLAGASSLTERVNPDLTLLSALKRVSLGKKIPFIRATGYSPNPYNLIGKAAPTFKAPHVLKKESLSLKETLKAKKPVLVVFWSITCPHCRMTIPYLDQYMRKKSSLRVISLVLGVNDKRRKMVKKFVKDKSLSMTILEDPKSKFAQAYRVMKVPTLYLVDTKGTIRNVRIGGGKKIGELIDQMLQHTKL